MIDKATLLVGAALPTAEVEIPRKGTVLVRALTRAEMLSIPGELSVLEVECKMISMGMTNPQLTESEVAEWQASSPVDEMTLVVRKINELGGIGRDADKSAYKSV